MENTFVFNETPGLGNVVSDVKPFCKLTKNMDVLTYKDIVGDYIDKDNYPGLVGKKFSRLCGFTFKTNSKTAPTKMFQIVYVPKLKGPYSRNGHGLHGWYCWMILPTGDRNVISIDDMKRKYGFDVNKFFHSDYFEKYLPIFEANLTYVLANQIQTLIDQMVDDDNYKDLVRNVNAIKDSVPKMQTVQQFVTPDTKYDDEDVPEYAQGSAPKIGHAKIAYNADKTYRLKHLDKKTQKSYRPQDNIDK